MSDAIKTYKVIKITTTKINWLWTILIFVVGMGIGWILIFFIPKKVHIETFDYSETNLALAHELYPNDKIEIQIVTANVYKRIAFSHLNK